MKRIDAKHYALVDDELNDKIEAMCLRYEMINLHKAFLVSRLAGGNIK
jgi:hypothetical protein